MNSALSCFQAYDVRGKLGVERGQPIDYCIGRAYAQFLGAQRVAIGDMCSTSAALRTAALRCDETDGISLEFADRRFNLRMSNIEPRLRIQRGKLGRSHPGAGHRAVDPAGHRRPPA